MEKLGKLPAFKGRRGPVVLCIMDGVGYGPRPEGDAVRNAYTPNLDWLHANCPHRQLKAHGKAVGLPSDEDMGNSEVGHNAIGCGRVFAQGAKLVDTAIENGRLFEGAVWRRMVENCKEHDSKLHFVGLFSDGNVHSHLRHLKAMVEKAREAGVQHVRLHVLLDGRDVGETSALDYVDPWEEYLQGLREAGLDYRIASGGGRMQVTMDRYEADWSMVERGWNIMVHGQGRQFASAHEAIETLRQETEAIDQDLPGFVIAADGKPVGTVTDNDAVIMYNFRGDRAIELTKTFEQEDFDKFDRGRRPDVVYAGMMEYDSDKHIPHRYLVEPPQIERTMGEYLAVTGVRQLACSETQKFGHVTYFFNGNRTGMFNEKLECYLEVPSDLVPFEQRPWMKAAEITDEILRAIQGGDYPFIRLNFANGDMVGHTGNFAAATEAVGAVDLCLARLMKAVAKAGGVMVITADHGNADQMYEFNKKAGDVKMENGKPKAMTAHTLNPVPCIIYDPESQHEYRLVTEGAYGISSLAATCLNLLGYAAPADYDDSLLAFD